MIKFETEKLNPDTNGNPRYLLRLLDKGKDITIKAKGILGRYTKKGLIIQSYNINADKEFILSRMIKE